MTQAASHTPPLAFVGKRRGLLLFTIALGVLLNPLNSSMIAVALARLQTVFHLDFTSVSWLISTYYLASAIAQPVLGKVADLVGRKRVFLIGILLVAASTISAPFSPNFAWLIALRLIQSIGSGAIFPAGMGIVRNYIKERQANALAILAVFSSGAAAFGPSIGGIMMNWGDWPAIFWVNIPVIVVGLAFGWWVLPRDNVSRGASAGVSGAIPVNGAGAGAGEGSAIAQGNATTGGGRQSLLRQLDLVGIGLFTVLIVFALLFLLSIPTGLHMWSGVIAVLALVAYLWWELRVAQPFIDLRMFRKNMGLSWVLIQFVTVNIIFYSIFFGMPTYLQEVRHYDAQVTGFLMLCVAGFSVFIAPITGRWVEKSGVRPPLLLAGVCMTAGSLLFLTLHQASPIWWLAVVLSVLGFSNGFNNVGLQTALFRVSPKEIISTASGLFQTSRYMGTIFSTVLLGLLLGNNLSVGELHHLGVVLAGLGALVIWMSWRLPGKR